MAAGPLKLIFSNCAVTQRKVIAIFIYLNTVRILQIVHNETVSQFSRINQLTQNFSSQLACAIGFGYA